MIYNLTRPLPLGSQQWAAWGEAGGRGSQTRPCRFGSDVVRSSRSGATDLVRRVDRSSYFRTGSEFRCPEGHS
jgi:hypothetical protein